MFTCQLTCSTVESKLSIFTSTYCCARIMIHPPVYQPGVRLPSRICTLPPFTFDSRNTPHAQWKYGSQGWKCRGCSVEIRPLLIGGQGYPYHFLVKQIGLYSKIWSCKDNPIFRQKFRIQPRQSETAISALIMAILESSLSTWKEAPSVRISVFHFPNKDSIGFNIGL